MLSAASFIRGCMNPFISQAHQAALDRISELEQGLTSERIRADHNAEVAVDRAGRIAFLEKRLTEIQARDTELVLENREYRRENEELKAEVEKQKGFAKRYADALVKQGVMLDAESGRYMKARDERDELRAQILNLQADVARLERDLREERALRI